MLIDISPILRGETDIIDIDYSVAPPADFDDIRFTGDISVRGRVKNMAGYMTLEISAAVPFTAHCSRCWKEIASEFTLDFSKRIAEKNTLQNEDNDDYIIIEKNNIVEKIKIGKFEINTYKKDTTNLEFYIQKL